MLKLACTVLLLAGAACAHQPASPYWGELEPGGYVPGAKFVTFEDAARPWSTSGVKPTPRQIRALVFYPAGPVGEKLTFRQLLVRSCGTPACAEAWARSLSDYRKDLKPEDVGGLLEYPLLSKWEANAVSGTFPVVIFDGGLTSDALTYVPLQEFLASHGFIVVSLPSLPHAEGKPLAFDVAGVESKAKDVLTVVKQLGKIPNADAERVALAAWSVGGVAITLAQMQSANVDAVLSLDGGMGYDYGPPLAKQSSHYDVKKASVPYLHITGMKPNAFNVPKGFAFFGDIPAQQRFLGELQGLNHSNFVVQGGPVAYARDKSEAGRQFWTSNERLAQLSLLFLKSFAGGGDGKDFLKQANALDAALLKVKPATK